jgi:hypothetical protein
MGKRYNEGVHKMTIAFPFTSSSTIALTSEASTLASSRVLFIFQLPATIFLRIVNFSLIDFARKDKGSFESQVSNF